MATNKNNHVGFSIRILWNLAGLSQAELAEKIGKTRGMVSYIEKQGKVNHYTLKDIANALNTSIEAIETYSNENKIISINQISETRKLIPLDNNSLKREIELLKELIENQKKIIELLEKR